MTNTLHTSTLHMSAPVNEAGTGFRLRAKTLRALAVLIVGALAMSACSGTRSPQATPGTSEAVLPTARPFSPTAEPFSPTTRP